MSKSKLKAALLNQWYRSGLQEDHLSWIKTDLFGFPSSIDIKKNMRSQNPSDSLERSDVSKCLVWNRIFCRWVPTVVTANFLRQNRFDTIYVMNASVDYVNMNTYYPVEPILRLRFRSDSNRLDSVWFRMKNVAENITHMSSSFPSRKKNILNALFKRKDDGCWSETRSY